MIKSVLLFLGGIILISVLVGGALWYYTSEYPRRRKLTPEQRAEEDRQIDERISKL